MVIRRETKEYLFDKKQNDQDDPTPTNHQMTLDDECSFSFASDVVFTINDPVTWLVCMADDGCK